MSLYWTFICRRWMACRSPRRSGTIADGRTLPRIIAMTADIEGCSHMPRTARISTTSSRSRSTFTRSASWSRSRRSSARDRLCRHPYRSAQHLPTSSLRQTRPSFFDSLGYEFLSWPSDLGATRLSARGIQATLGDPRFDAILIKEPASAEDLAEHLAAKRAPFASGDRSYRHPGHQGRSRRFQARCAGH